MSEYSDDLLGILRTQLADAERTAVAHRGEESTHLTSASAWRGHAEEREGRAAELRRLLREIDPEHTEQYADPAPLQGTARIAQALREMAEDLESTWSGGYRYTNITVRMLDVPDGQLLIEALPAAMPGATIRPNSGFSCVDAFEGTADGAVNREFVIEPAPAPVDVHAETRGERDDRPTGPCHEDDDSVDCHCHLGAPPCGRCENSRECDTCGAIYLPVEVSS